MIYDYVFFAKQSKVKWSYNLVWFYHYLNIGFLFEKQQNDNSNTTSNQKQTRQLRQSTNIKNLNNSNSNTLTSSQQQQPQQQLVQSIEKDSLIKEQQQQQQQQDIEQEVKIQSLPKYTPTNRHPGGKRALIRFAGKDGTENVQFHSKTMLQLLNNHYFIGHLRKDQQAVEPSRCSII
ncbi:hypothetical protein PPL_03352 [Heterostelium album PN500]|uniref:Cytochrome b5 heme-binding domain-containing protein n=1 Tax=Heterostelium pallidum (strain ATCC 26659 / Pp 5 / PN500) TaxID=670386 RepID=D3B4M7_HETP5|nr:hypothetical protein PPL_03352 [Heterostelium album PN500]EFA84275.1 hypothetical protein PPL_03352 [Heterostelium album PN500]|eukprot:XP_020436391.1 hypothetical protein PPL_03352 [Heterostelium album PN500]